MIGNNLIPQAWHPQNLSVDIAREKMLANSERAVKEHYPLAPHVYAPHHPVVNFDEQIPLERLNFNYFANSVQGRRQSMEDAHCFKKDDQKVIIGVFDGHGGKQVAQYACKIFEKNFFPFLKFTKDNVHEAFQKIFHAIHTQVIKSSDHDTMGTTAVVSYIDLTTNLIYTATLGDSEANIYRKIDGELKSIPLSCVRNWNYPKEVSRLKNHSNLLQAPEGAKSPYLTVFTPGRNYRCLNLSRAIGDAIYNKVLKGPVISHKPKITLGQLKKNDVLILACDGLKDFVPEEDIIKLISHGSDMEKKEEGYDFASKLVNFALHDKISQDNVTVLSIQVS